MQIVGSFDADNQMTFPWPDGECYFYGYGEELLSHLASGTAETTGLFTAEEGDDTISVGGAVNVSLPIDFSGDEGDLNGDDAVSHGGTKPNAVENDAIKFRGIVVIRAQVDAGAWESTGTVETKLHTFSMTYEYN